jgi:Ca-activated chloride channel homolog
MNRRAGVALGCLFAVAAVAVAAQSVDGRLRIESPAAGSLVSGPVVIRASVAPDVVPRVQMLTFYVDGTAVCSNVAVGRPECAWNAGADVKAHLIRVVATLSGEERLVATVRTEKLGYAETVRVDVVQIAALVRDGDGKFVSGLPREAFRVFENGAPQRLTHFAAQDSSLDVVLAIDVSGSMADSLADLKQAVSAFLQAVGSNDRVTVVAFNDAMFTLASQQTSPEARAAAVGRLQAWGGTALYDVLSKSIDMLTQGTGRRALVLFTDGEDRSSQTTLAAVKEKLESTDSTLFAVGLGRGATVDELKRALQDLTEANGGSVLFAEKSRDLKGVFARVVEELSHQYLLGYESTNQKRDGTWRPVRVETTEKRYRVHARQGYRAPER